MSEKQITEERKYEACDWCGKEITSTEQAYRIMGDFPTVSVHTAKDPFDFHTCLREVVARGIKNKD